MSDEIQIRKPIMISLDKLHPNDWNPNEQTGATFNALVDEIKQDGFDHPLQVVPCTCEKLGSEHYQIIGGEHRFRAATILGMKEVPCVVYESWDDFVQKVKTVRRNLLTGDLNDRKFTALIESMKNDGKSDAELWEQMGFKNEDEFLKHVLTKSDEDDERKKTWLKDLMKGANKEIEAVNALSDVLNHIFVEYGETVPQSFLFFAYKGKTHLMVLMDDELFDLSEKMVTELKKTGRNVNDFMKELFAKKLVDSSS